MNPQIKANAIPIADTKDMSREEWLEIRRKGIGGSDVAALAGLSKYKSPFALYLEKTGEVKFDDVTSEAAYFGNVLEDVVAKEFAIRTGLKVKKRNQMLRHPDHPFMMANLDRVIVGANEILECKTASEYLKGEWEGDEVPAAYLLQIMHYMAVTGADAAWIAVLIGGNKFVYKRVERDEELIAYLIDIERNFWENHILAGVAPEIDGTEAAKSFLNQLYPEATVETSVDLSHEVDALVDALDVAKEEEKAAKKRITELENRIKMELGENECGSTEQNIVTWKNVTSNRVDSNVLKTKFPEVYEQVLKASTARRFAIKPNKGAK